MHRTRKTDQILRIIGLVLAVLIATTAEAQATADIVGTATDASQGAVAGAKVTVTNAGTNVARSVATSSSGDYAFTALPIGTYSLTVEQNGFKTFTASSIVLADGDRARIDARMELGVVSQTVEVSGSAAPLLQTDNSTVGGLVTSRAVEDLPVNGRNFIKLAQLAPGASDGQASDTGSVDGRRMTSTVIANGQGSFENNFILDGMDDNERIVATVIVKPSIDALQEVKVNTSLYTADVGRVGGAVISMVTKSGTNQIHGTAFEFFRNNVLDATNYFNIPQAGNPLAGVNPEYRQNQFGGSVGGPIKKDKTFFFADYEGLRIIQAQTFTDFTPTPCELGTATCNGITQVGNFSADTGRFILYDPNTGLPFGNNVIPLNSIPTDSKNYAKLYPTVTGCTVGPCKFVTNQLKIQYAHAADLRIDHRFSDKDSIFGRYSINNSDTTNPQGLPRVTVAGVSVGAGGQGFGQGLFGTTAHERQQNINIGWTHVIRTNLLLDLHTSLTRYVVKSNGFNGGQQTNTLFGGPGNVDVPGVADGLATVILGLGAGPYTTLGDAFAVPTYDFDTDYNYAGNLTWIKGAHNFKFGFNLMRRDWTVFQHLFAAQFQFSPAVTANPSPTPSSPPSGDAFASMLTGYANVVQRNMALIAPEDRSWEVGGYMQDDWRAAHWLTFNLGVRYDIFTPTTEKHNRLSNFDPTNTSQLLLGKVIQAGQNGVSDSVNITSIYNQFQPRLGFAATLKHRFVLRGGLGTSYFVSNNYSPAALKNAPFSAAVALSGPKIFNFGSGSLPDPTLNIATECLIPACGATGTNTVNDALITNFRNQEMIMYNLTLEKAFGANDISLGWVGEPGRHLARVLANVDIPLPPNGPGGCGAVKVIVLPSPCQPYFAQLPLTTSIQLVESNGYSSYNGMNLIYQRRYERGLTVLANYTYSQAFANTGSSAGACATCGIVPTNLRYDYGNSPNEVRHRVAVSVNYEIPFGKSATGAMGQIVKGWQMNGIYSFESGLPFVVSEPTNQMGIAIVGSFGGVNDRPNVLPRQPFQQSINQWFNTSDFALQPFGTAGNEEINQYFGPAQRKLDFSLFKDFSLTESVKLQFRTEVFNLFNTPSFANPSGGISAWCSSSALFNGKPCTPGAPVNFTNGSSFGKITATSGSYTPRQIQFALKLLF